MISIPEIRHNIMMISIPETARSWYAPSQVVSPQYQENSHRRRGRFQSRRFHVPFDGRGRRERAPPGKERDLIILWHAVSLFSTAVGLRRTLLYCSCR